MTMTDPIADMLTRIRNANVAFHDDVPMPSSKLKEAVAKILEREGYISGYEVDDQPGRPGRRLTIRMKYSSDRRRTISGLKRVSRPGLLVERVDDTRSNRSLHGLQRTLIANMVTGVSEGFVKELEIVGVGYRAQAQGPSKIEILVGFSHPVHVEAPEGVTFEVPQPTR